jgi:hypothetical protein
VQTRAVDVVHGTVSPVPVKHASMQASHGLPSVENEMASQDSQTRSVDVEQATASCVPAVQGVAQALHAPLLTADLNVPTLPYTPLPVQCVQTRAVLVVHWVVSSSPAGHRLGTHVEHSSPWSEKVSWAQVRQERSCVAVHAVASSSPTWHGDAQALQGGVLEGVPAFELNVPTLPYAPLPVHASHTRSVVAEHAVVSVCPAAQTVQALQALPSAENMFAGHAVQMRSVEAEHGTDSCVPGSHGVAQLLHATPSVENVPI